ncbi:hypothetical protein ACIPY0_12255 [Paenarthrobacter nicotinovorans]|uniref:hypothetical protein n=1 Tax=Paenarthrobacter nicotinovorans TaxID=29320 RepID=UPI00381FB7A5
MSESIHILSEGGTVFELALPLHEVVEAKLVKGQIRRVNPDGTPYVEKSPDEVPAPPTSRPGVNEDKKAWVAWAVVQGLTPDDADALTKRDLIERFGADKPATPETGDQKPDGTDTGQTPAE